ncbi:hypothetical protein [Inquilinus sp. CA228]|uniref:hypothetical protein n=1 Tax=Inquilinus sp. CA228 TaxID=3455609 RepID=UPI003F8D6D63
MVPIPIAAEFLLVARAILAARGDPLGSALFAEGRQPQSKAAMILRAAIAAGTTTDPSWASALSGYRTVSDAFIASMRPNSVFVRLAEDGALHPIPIGIAIAIVTGAAVGAAIPENKPKLISRLSLTADRTEPRKTSAILIVSNELARSLLPGAGALLATELRGACASALDGAFLATATEGVVPIASTGVSPAQVAADLKSMLTTVNVSGAGKLYWIGAAVMANGFATAVSSAGDFTYPTMSPSGGELLNTPFLVSDGLAADELVLVDGSALAGMIDLAVLDGTTAATIEMDDNPADPPGAGTLTSLFQQDLVGLRCETWFALERIRANGAAKLSGLVWP